MNEEIENPLESLKQCIAFDVEDWSTTKRRAWIYGIVMGWDTESLTELALKFRWPQSETARLRRLHKAFSLLDTGVPSP